MKILDLGCGLWGWSEPWIKAGFEVYGVDIKEHSPRKEKNVHFIKCDIRDFNEIIGAKVVFCSMPCTEFSIAKFAGYGTQKEMEGLDLVQAALFVINRENPKYWVMENVQHLEDFIGPAKKVIPYTLHHAGKKAYLWGNFPDFDIDIRHLGSPAQIGRKGDPRRSRIPEKLAESVYCKIVNQKRKIIGERFH